MENKNEKVGIILIIVGIVIIFIGEFFIVGSIVYRKFQQEVNECNDYEYEYSEESIVYDYNCSFTRTYRVVNLFKDYISEVPESSYIAIDSYQNHYLELLRLPSSQKEGLEEDKYYEFTFSIKGKTDYELEDMEDMFDYIDEDNRFFNVSLSIAATDKEGMAQINEPICRYHRIYRNNTENTIM